MKKNSLRLSIAFIVMVVLMISCTKTDRVEKAETPPEPIAQKVEEQLKLSQDNLSLNGIAAKIISYKFETEIKTEEQLATVKESLVNKANYVPQYNGLDAATFSVSTIDNRMAAADKTPEDAAIIQNIRDIVLPEIKIGQKIVSIVWEADGKRFTSRCIYNEEGVVYDNMLSNIVFLVAEETPKEEIKAGRIMKKDAKIEAQYSFTATAVNYTITWIWGGTRGKIIIKHYIIWNGVNYIIDHGGTADAWMSAGSAKGRWHNNSLSRYSRSKMAWGYGWATPTASFSITFNSSNLTFSAGTSGVGSKGSGSGIHTIYLP